MPEVIRIHEDITEAQATRDPILMAVAYSTAADHYAGLTSKTGKSLATKYRNLAAKWETRANVDAIMSTLEDAGVTFDA